MMGSREQQFHEERTWHEWYNALVQSISVLTREEYATYITSLSLPRESHENQNARERLITSHLREILSMAKDRPHYRLPIADYVGIGNLAVVKHFDEFAPDRGAFSEFVRITVRMDGLYVSLPLAANVLLASPDGQLPGKQEKNTFVQRLGRKLKADGIQSMDSRTCIRFYRLDTLHQYCSADRRIRLLSDAIFARLVNIAILKRDILDYRPHPDI
jgi:hypothetical protein